MKKIICALLAFILALSYPVFSYADELVSCTFEEGEDMKLTLYGNAKTVFDTEKNSRVLYLDGSSGAYAEFPAGTFDGTDTATVLFDIKPASQSGNFFTFAVGKDSDKYSFFRIRGSEARNAITLNSYPAERETRTNLNYSDNWMSVAIAFDSTANRIYINGKLCAENADTGIKLSDLGSGLLAYLGKSFYSNDGYFKGSFDNVKVYNTVLSESEIKSCVSDSVSLLAKATVGSVIDINLPDVNGTDGHTAVYTSIDRANGIINSYVKPSQSIGEIPLNVVPSYDGSVITVNGEAVDSFPCTVDLTSPVTLKISANGKEETYTVNTPETAKNPVLSGQYADPDIAVFDGRFWLFPTTDGFGGWSSTQFHAFSSLDMVNWLDEGVILDVKEKSARKNSQGVNIAVSPWSDINAWAPAAAEKNGKYYFYYCSNIKSDLTPIYGSGMAIGAAWASSPSGPYTALDRPLIYPKLMEESGIGFSGQTIDPSVFTDSDGTSYILFGNGSATYAKLGGDMLSIDKASLKMLYGLNEFRESVAVFKRNDTYYFTWSCDDTGSENYHVNWGYSKALDGEITNRGTLISKDEENGILGTGHQSILYLPENDKCFIAYHRFYTPLGIADGGFGFHRETCIDEITFKPGIGIIIPDLLNKVTPTYGGSGAFDTNGNSTGELIPTHYVPPSPVTPAPSPAPQKKITVKKTAITKLIRGRKSFTAKWKRVSGTTGYQLQYATDRKFKKAKKKTVKGAKKYKLTVKKLKAKKKYYVRIRAYKKYKGKTYFSKWSKVKAVRVK